MVLGLNGFIISKPLSFIINQCLKMGIFLNELEIAKIIPILKSEDHQQENVIFFLKQMDFCMEVNMGFVNVSRPNLPHNNWLISY